jgi:hypothetical protein
MGEGASMHATMDNVDRQPILSPEFGPSNWSRRYKANIERLGSGEEDQIRVVIQQLSEREKAKGISQGERRMLARARQMLDDLGGGPSGVREPRRPLPPNDTISSMLSEPEPIQD